MAHVTLQKRRSHWKMMRVMRISLSCRILDSKFSLGFKQIATLITYVEKDAHARLATSAGRNQTKQYR